ncbi:MAG: glycoside hydrolase family 3 C-terminal domain-containing protein [Clostridia bacterium]|nr:glycoside hydrolase family 3 C-terminal domain-containing protein [Clostridia bacterium]
MKSQTKSHRTLKKVFLNIVAVLFALVFTGNVIAGENAGQINQALGTKTSMTVSTLPEGQEEGYARYFDSRFSSIAELKAAGEAKVREVEGEGIVLLKNEGGVLPLAQGSKVSLVGVTIMDPVYGGTGSGAVDADGAPNYYDVMTQAGYEVVNKPLLDYYVENEARRNTYEIGEVRWKKASKNHDDTMGQGEDVIYVVGRVGGEGDDVTAEKEDALDGDYLTLNEDELSILEGLKEMKDDGDIRSITVIINSANPIATAFLYNEDYGVDAALWVGSVGQTGLYAVGDVISGAVNPSGSLPDTWWMDNRLDPVMNNFGSYTYQGADKYNFGAFSAYAKYVVYQEGIYVGYKYTETRYEDVVMGTENAGNFAYNAVVSYPFGYGMSYTTFDLSDVAVTASGEGQDKAYTMTVKVTNTGDVAGKKTVQVYAQKPYTDYDREYQIEKASVELVGYAKTALLAAGESETVTISIPEYYLTSYDALGTGSYILDEGTYYLTAADNAHQAANQILAAKGYTEENGMTGSADASLVYSFEQSFDASTYSTAMGTGEEVKSLFADADMNRYEGRGDNTIVYYSRSNWAGTVTPGPVSLTMTDKMAEDVVLDDNDLPDATGVEFPKMGQNANLQLINMMDYDYDDPMWDTFLDQLTYEDMSALTLTGLRETVGVSSIGKPGTIDHNGPSGVTQKYSIGQNGFASVNDDPDKDLKGTCYPCNGIIAATFNDKLVEEVGELIGEDSMWAGYAGLYGTGLNIHRSPYAGRVFEYYSEDGMLTGLIDTAETLGIQSKGVYVYNKHFVCNDQENNRAGIGTWIPEQALREIYLRAFELPILYADAKCVMTGYDRLGVNWCGAYSELLIDWLRGEAGMKGFTVSDMYDATYMVPVHEIVAGNDIPDGELDPSTLSSFAPGAAKANAAVAQAMRTSSKRVLYTVLHSRGMDGISEYTKVVSLTPWWQTTLDVAQWSLLGLTCLALILLLLDIFKKEKAPKAKK